jgi:uncharacterized membrane protein
MTLLLLGVVLWSFAHLIPSAMRPLREYLIEELDAQKYQGLFALTILLSVVLMVFGWRSTDAVSFYSSGIAGRWVAIVLVFPALVLFAASGVETNIKRWIRHPQLMGVAVWAFGHLVANGESRAIVLFGGLLVWSVATMMAINQRDGEWEKPERLPLQADLKPLVAGAVVYVALYFAHPWIAGVSVAPI